MDWKKLWNERGITLKNESLSVIDGFDHGVGKLNEDMIKYIANNILTNLSINNKSIVLEVGCGSGMLLNYIRGFCLKIYGIDYADTLIKIAQNHFPEGTFHKGEASDLHYFKDNMFDSVYSFSVFHYFPNLQYAKKSIREMLRVSKNKRIYIGDIPDLEKKKEAELSREVPSDHLYYPKSFFLGNYKCEIFDSKIDGYGNSKFRYNVVIKR